MLSLRVEEKFGGPTIFEIEPLLIMGSDPYDVKWGNSKRELHVLRKYAGHDITLVVPDLVAMERAASLLGLEYTMHRELVQNGAACLNKPDGRWREFSQHNGQYVARGTLMFALSNKMRKGGDSPALRKALIENVLNHISPTDLEALYILRLKGARV